MYTCGLLLEHDTLVLQSGPNLYLVECGDPSKLFLRCCNGDLSGLEGFTQSPSRHPSESMQAVVLPGRNCLFDPHSFRSDDVTVLMPNKFFLPVVNCRYLIASHWSIGCLSDKIDSGLILTDFSWLAIIWFDGIYLICREDCSFLLSSLLASDAANSDHYHYRSVMQRAALHDIALLSPSSAPEQVLDSMPHNAFPKPGENSVCHIATSGSTSTYQYSVETGIGMATNSGIADIAALCNPHMGVIWKTERRHHPLLDRVGLRMWVAHHRIPRGSSMKPECLPPYLAGIGIGEEDEQARLIARWEALERWCLMEVPDQKNVLIGPQSASMGNFVAPTDLPYYGSKQFAKPDFPYERFNPAADYVWIRGEECGTSNSAYIHSDLLLWPSLHSKPCVQATSSGTAAFRTEAGALSNALLELIERHCALTAWSYTLAPPRIPRLMIGDLGNEAGRHLNSLGYEFHLLDISPSFIDVSVTLALAFGRTTGSFGLLSATAAAFETATSARKAIQDLLALIAHREIVGGKEKSNSISKSIRTRHMEHYRSHKNAQTAEFLIANRDFSPPMIGRPDLAVCSEKAVHYLTDCLRSIGTVYFVRRSPSTLRERGFHVVSAIASGLQPIHFGADRFRWCNLRMKPFHLKIQEPDPRQHLLNFQPHCFL